MESNKNDFKYTLQGFYNSSIVIIDNTIVKHRFEEKIPQDIEFANKLKQEIKSGKFNTLCVIQEDEIQNYYGPKDEIEKFKEFNNHLFYLVEQNKIIFNEI